MYLTLQFPIADVRPFLQGDDVCLASPNWPTPEAERQFVRYFGPVHKRLLGGSGVKWMGDELYYCDARKAIRLPNLGSYAYPEWGDRRRVLRRLFLHKPALARVEVAFAITLDRKQPFADDEIIRPLADLLTIPTRMPFFEKAEHTNSELALVLQGRRLAHLLFKATTSVTNPTSTPVEEWAVRDAEPMLLVEYGRDELKSVPEYVKRLPEDQTHGFLISYTTMRFQGRTVVIWFLEASPAGESKVARRQLRLCLLRLHLEYQVLGLILNTVCGRPEFKLSIDGGERLKSYLDAATRRLFKTTRFGVNQRPLYVATAAYRELVPEDNRVLLKDKLKGLSERVRKRVDGILQNVEPVSSIDSVTIDGEHGHILIHTEKLFLGGTFVKKQINITQNGTGNILNVAKYMSNVSNQVNNNSRRPLKMSRI